MTQTRNKTIVRLAVTTALATTTLSACAGGPAPSAHVSAAAAEAAIKDGKFEKGINHAEAAVLAAPRDANTRTLLGNAYLEAGRFQSASQAFTDAVELGDTAPRTVVSLALAQIGSGDQRGAINTLTRWETAIDPADFGLAISLAGQPERGIHVLTNTLRGGQNTPKVRQNLAYAYALSGQWRAASLMVAEDIPADQVGTRLSEWGSMIKPDQYQTRIASLIGVQAAEDSGQPAKLALNNFPTVPQMAAEAVDVPAVAEAKPAKNFAAASELPAINAAPAKTDRGDAGLADAGLRTVAPAPKPVTAPPAPVRTARAPAPATSAPRAGASNDGSKQFAQAFANTPAPAKAAPAPAPAPARSTPARTAAPKTAPARTAAAATRTTTPARTATPAASPSLAKGDYNIQLGSYFSMSDAQSAWKRFQAQYPELADAERVISKARVNGKIYYRVAAAGFARSSADQMCSTVKRNGGGCLAYAARAPLPGHMGEATVRVASR